MRKMLLTATAAAVMLSSCHHRHQVAQTPLPPSPNQAETPAPAPPSTPPTPSTPTPPPNAPATPAPPIAVPESGETGVASWYGYPFHGRQAASGDIYDMEQMTAAHKTLAFNTMVRVHNLDNDKTVDVRINDRGPFVDGRIIDLSHAAARAIAMIGPGTAHVRLEILSAPAPVSPAWFGVQVGAFRNRDNAERLCRLMQEKYGKARLVERTDTPGFWHVVVGLESTQDDAGTLAGRIRGENSAITATFVVRIDSI